MTAQLAAHGRLGTDPRAIDTAKGTRMGVCSIAVSIPERHGEDERTLWFDLVAFARAAELLLKHKKGELVSVAGRLQGNSYTTQSGEVREQLQIVADSIVSARSVRPGGDRKKKPASDNANEAAAPFDDDIPF